MGEDLQVALVTWFGDDLELLVKMLAGEVQSARELTRLVSDRQRKASFHLEFTDGRQFKARRYRTAAAISSAVALSPLLAALPFSRVLVNRGLVALEQWIEGTPLSPAAVSAEQARAAGALLGRIHCIADLPTDLPAQMPAGNWYADNIGAHLQELVAAGALTASVAARLHRAASANRPERLDRGLVHGDFCADNIVVDGSGGLFVVDNESLQLAALDYDLARCWARWPMSQSQRIAFAEGYRGFRGLGAFAAHATFWAIQALSQSIAVHLRHNKPCEAALAALRQIGCEPGTARWPELSALP